MWVSILYCFFGFYEPVYCHLLFLLPMVHAENRSNLIISYKKVFETIIYKKHDKEMDEVRAREKESVRDSGPLYKIYCRIHS